jgi:hypothetical protein
MWPGERDEECAATMRQISSTTVAGALHSSSLLNWTDKSYHSPHGIELTPTGAFELRNRKSSRVPRSPHILADECAVLAQCGAQRVGAWGARLNGQPLKALRARSRLQITVTLLCLLACTVQSFVAQTHVHPRRAQTPASVGYQASADADAVSLPSSSDEDSARHVRRDGSSSCPLCQVVLHGGAAPAPAFALSLPLPTTISVAPDEQASPTGIVAVSFSWQGRAPPST